MTCSWCSVARYGELTTALLVALAGLATTLVAASGPASAACPTHINRTYMNQVDWFEGEEPVAVGVTVAQTTTFTVYVDARGDCAHPEYVTVTLFHGSDTGSRIDMGRLPYGFTLDDSFIYQGHVVWDPAKMDNAEYPGAWTSKTTATKATPTGWTTPSTSNASRGPRPTPLPNRSPRAGGSRWLGC